MRARALSIAGAWVFEPTVFPDNRGLFVAPYQQSAFEQAVGRAFPVAQTNHSVSRRGVVRGVHFADIPPGQAKYVYCPRGRLLDVAVDVRAGSPTFGEWTAVELNDDTYRAIYLAEGVGHAFCALADDTVMAYLCSTPYNPAAERTVTPLDPELALPWPAEPAPILSEKDTAAPTLAQAAAAGLLPRWADCHPAPGS